MDLAREKRLAEEAMNTQEILRGTQQSMQLVMKMFPNSSLFDEFVCKLGVFWHEWAILKRE
jgi:hypothetical protein